MHSFQPLCLVQAPRATRTKPSSSKSTFGHFTAPSILRGSKPGRRGGPGLQVTMGTNPFFPPTSSSSNGELNQPLLLIMERVAARCFPGAVCLFLSLNYNRPGRPRRLLYYYYLFIYFVACGTSLTREQPTPHEVETESNHWTTREAPGE